MRVVDHPDHYISGRTFEPIDVITSWGLGFCLGNAVKYISRAGRKGPALDDLRKAKWYIDYEIVHGTPMEPCSDEMRRELSRPALLVARDWRLSDELAGVLGRIVTGTSKDLMDASDTLAEIIESMEAKGRWLRASRPRHRADRP